MSSSDEGQVTNRSFDRILEVYGLEVLLKRFSRSVEGPKSRTSAEPEMAKEKRNGVEKRYYFIAKMFKCNLSQNRETYLTDV